MGNCRVVLTGVSGFVGGAVGVHLRQLGYDVIGVSRTEPRPSSSSRFIAHDLTQTIPASWPDCDVVVHCAALSSPWAAPERFRANNVEATRNLLSWAERRGAAQFVFISSSSVYYESRDQLGIREDSQFPLKPINEYAATKLEAEGLVRKSAVPHVILRPRAVFGPNDTVLFPRILRAARRGVLPRLTRPDGKPAVADLIYIENLSHYIERSIALGVEGEINLTNNEPVELYPFLDSVLERLGLPKPKREVSMNTALKFARVAELASQYLFHYSEPPLTRFGVEVMGYSKTFDVSRMLSVLGQPQITMRAGVDRFVDWQKMQ